MEKPLWSFADRVPGANSKPQVYGPEQDAVGESQTRRIAWDLRLPVDDVHGGGQGTAPKPEGRERHKLGGGLGEGLIAAEGSRPPASARIWRLECVEHIE